MKTRSLVRYRVIVFCMCTCVCARVRLTVLFFSLFYFGFALNKRCIGLVRFCVRLGADDGVERLDGRHRAQLAEQNDHALRRDRFIFLVWFAVYIRPNDWIRRGRGV